MAQHFKVENYVLVFKRLSLLLWIVIGTKSFSQVFYSVNPKYLKNKTERNNLLSDYKYNYPDTSITDQANYFSRNFMGNLGLSSPDYIWRYGTDDLGFRLVQLPLSLDKVRESEVNYFRSMGPYASLNGIGGSKELQIFRMLFTHTYKEKVNITVKFNRYTSKGFYKRQQTYTNNFYLSSNYTTRKKNVGYYFYLLNNGNKNRENGGVTEVIIPDSSLLEGKELAAVRLSNANRDNREMIVMLNPWIRLNRPDSVKGVDHYLQLKSKASFNSYRYKDPSIRSDKFYKVAYLDTLQTIDSTNVRKISNELSYSLLSRDKAFGFSLGYRNEISQVWQHLDSVFMNHLLQSDLVFMKPIWSADTLKKQFLETRFNLQYVLNGANSGNYKLESNSAFFFNEEKKRNVFFDLLYENRSADYIYNNWVSNHFFWFNNGYKAQQQLQLKLGINLGKVFTASVFYQSIAGYLYFDTLALSKQLSGTVNNLGLNLNFTKIFFRHLGLGLNHIYQNTSQPAYVRVPQNVSTVKLFYAASLSHNNLLLQIGAQIQVYESFVPYAYMPSTQMFYLQDTYKTSTYPYLDAYLSARIRPVSFFLKVENILQVLKAENVSQVYVPNSYYFVPGYYQPDLAFRFGLTWMFFD